MESDAPRADVLAARHAFFGRRATPSGLVPPAILKSWQRCAERGFDSHHGPLIEPEPMERLKEHRERNERLLRASRPELAALRREARDSGAIAILTDAAGVVLDAAGDAGFAGKAAGVALRPGVAWSEAATGTNAIGAALLERRSIEVRGAEHYFEPHRILTCAATPIFDPYGALLGAIDLSGPAAAPPAHALELTRLAVDQIERRMFEESLADAEVIRLHADPALLGTAQEGLLAFRGSRLVAANRHALRLLGIDWYALGARSFRDLFDGAPQRFDQVSRLRSREGVELHARLRPSPKPVGGVTLDAPPKPAPAATLEPARPEEGPAFDAVTRADLARAARLVDGDVPVLIRGETGAGKEVFARAVHALSRRADRAFVAVNCAALPETLIEAELFGYEEGAFTGARRAGSKGLLREADGGVLLLDEIGDMPLGLQARLLRALQERAVTPLGGTRPHPIDVRLVSATHQDLAAMVADGRFRADLYYRIAQYAFELPAFRQLPDRRAALAALWATLPTGGRRLAPETVERMAAFAWPGNHREIVGAMRAMIALSEPGETVGPDLLPPAARDAGSVAAPASAPAEGGLDAARQAAIDAALAAAGGNVAEAARRLGVSRSTLYRRGLARRR
ncbi:sigma-54-dependent Fis family transcriptional regulator [Methylopila turkensis]|nr:sigma-54-dependent Fis family transcriptional regulator [Methylopila turkensis]